MIYQDALIERLPSILPSPAHSEEGPLEEQEEQGRHVTQRLIGGDPGEVIVDVLDDGIEVSVFTAVWEGPHTLTFQGEPLKRFAWSDLPVDLEEALSVIEKLVGRARQLRVATYRRCKECGRTNPPEWMHGKAICQGCAQEHHGIVY